MTKFKKHMPKNLGDLEVHNSTIGVTSDIKTTPPTKQTISKKPQKINLVTTSVPSYPISVTSFNMQDVPSILRCEFCGAFSTPQVLKTGIVYSCEACGAPLQLKVD